MKPQPRCFFKQAIDNNRFPNKIVMDKSGSNFEGLENINFLLMLAGIISFIEIHQESYETDDGLQSILFC